MYPKGFTNKIHTIISLLWFVKDNSASIGEFYSYETVSTKLSILQSGGIYSDAEGEYKPESFDANDFTFAQEIYKKITRILPVVDTPKEQSPNSDYNYVNLGDTNRIQRSLSFINMARENSYLYLKIALYCSALECLFSTGGTELNYKISQRSALFLGGDYDTKKTTLTVVKNAYDVRSKFFHGDTVKKDLQNIKTVSKKLDQVLRSTLTKVIQEESAIFLDSKFSEVVTEYFDQKILK